MMIFSLFLKHKSKSEKSDSELLELFKKTNDNCYFAELFKRYTTFTFTISIKYFKNEEQSKEAVMQIFEKLLIEINNHKISNFKSWLHSVTRNHCLHIIRRINYEQKKEKDIEYDDDFFMELDMDLYHNNENDEEIMINKLEHSICKLNIEQKKCIELFYLQEKCYEEVSKITGYTMKEVKSYIQNGKRNLKLFLTGLK